MDNVQLLMFCANFWRGYTLANSCHSFDSGLCLHEENEDWVKSSYIVGLFFIKRLCQILWKYSTSNSIETRCFIHIITNLVKLNATFHNKGHLDVKKKKENEKQGNWSYRTIAPMEIEIQLITREDVELKYSFVSKE